ncbi:hypothetical protein HZB93_03635 [Candidatus Falkowbacteria bacterium]|nr:hypothetical protein [Candidatus Falkowbacteria bacterium]
MARATISQVHELGEQIRRGQIPAWKVRIVFGLSEKETETPFHMFLSLVKAAKAEIVSAEQMQMILEGRCESFGIFKVTVDYGLTLSEMIAAGRYDVVDSYITTEYFPVTGKGRVEREVVAVYLNREVKDGDVIAELALRGFRPAKIEDLLALSALHPDFREGFPTTVLGPKGDLSGDRGCFYTCHGLTEGMWVLAHGWFNLRLCVPCWGKSCRFLAVRKDAA